MYRDIFFKIYRSLRCYQNYCTLHIDELISQPSGDGLLSSLDITWMKCNIQAIRLNFRRVASLISLSFGRLDIAIVVQFASISICIRINQLMN